MMGGRTSGITIAFRNQGNNRSAYFVRDNTLTSGIGDAGYNAYPSFADLDKDGDYDMIMGRDVATFIHYKNAGTRTAPIWQMAPIQDFCITTPTQVRLRHLHTPMMQQNSE
ncbi:MAG: hypothetical protein HYV28_15430 [Ignavibacteriales bacterium]|nr:hypothetical protein [Ignavibacteriales bacterium]